MEPTDFPMMRAAARATRYFDSSVRLIAKGVAEGAIRNADYKGFKLETQVVPRFDAGEFVLDRMSRYDFRSRIDVTQHPREDVIAWVSPLITAALDASASNRALEASKQQQAVADSYFN